METYGELQFFSLNNGSVVMQAQNQAMKIIPNIQGASVLAYDWMANTLYWSSPRHNMVRFCVYLLCSPMGRPAK